MPLGKNFSDKSEGLFSLLKTPIQKPRQSVYALTGRELPDKYFYLFSRVKTAPTIAPIRTIGDTLTNSHSNA